MYCCWLVATEHPSLGTSLVWRVCDLISLGAFHFYSLCLISLVPLPNPYTLTSIFFFSKVSNYSHYFTMSFPMLFSLSPNSHYLPSSVPLSLISFNFYLWPSDIFITPTFSLSILHVSALQSVLCLFPWHLALSCHNNYFNSHLLLLSLFLILCRFPLTALRLSRSMVRSFISRIWVRCLGTSLSLILSHIHFLLVFTNEYREYFSFGLLSTPLGANGITTEGREWTLVAYRSVIVPLQG